MSKKGLIGVQMSTVAGLIPSLGAYGIMKAIHEAGYNCVEISQFPMTPENVAAFQQACKDFGMTVSSISAAVAPMVPGMPGEYLCNEADFKKMVADAKALNCDMMRIGMLPFTCMGSYEKAVEFAKEAEKYAVMLKEEGIDLYYHNHHVEFTRYNGELLLDIMRENAPHLGFELDIHWIHRGGQDPIKFIKKYAGAVRLLHLKDYRVGELPVPEGGINVTDRAAIMEFMKMFTGNIEFAEVGEGTLDIAGCIEAGLESGAEFFLVEQDNCYGRDPIDCLKTSRDNLIKLGYADWF